MLHFAAKTEHFTSSELLNVAHREYFDSTQLVYWVGCKRKCNITANTNTHNTPFIVDQQACSAILNLDSCTFTHHKLVVEVQVNFSTRFAVVTGGCGGCMGGRCVSVGGDGHGCV